MCPKICQSVTQKKTIVLAKAIVVKFLIMFLLWTLEVILAKCFLTLMMVQMFRTKMTAKKRKL